MLARYAPALVALLAASDPGSWRGMYSTRRPGLQVIRGLSPVCVGGLMVFAVRYLPLAEATVILFAGPFIVVALSQRMLGEQVDPASWIAVAIGFLAVLIVARPGFDALSKYTIFPAAAAVFYAILQLLSRRLASLGELPRTTVSWTLLVGTLISLPLAVMDWRSPDLYHGVILLCLGVSFGSGQYLLTKAFSLAPANVLTPFSYVQIISAAIFGWLVFHNVPDVWTISGMVLIVSAGIYVFGRSPASQA